MADRLIRGMALDSKIRFFAVDCTETVRYAVETHHLSITNAVLLGRMIAGALLMSNDLKTKNDSLTLKIEGNGPLAGGLVTVRSPGKVKGYVKHPEVETGLNLETKTFALKQGIGVGTLTVIKDIHLKAPYIGTIDLVSGEIGEDLAYYYVYSEQIPTAINLGILINPDGSVRSAGGVLLQLLPDSSEETVSLLEKRIARFPNLSDVMDMGKSIEEIVQNILLKDIQSEVAGISPVNYACDCSKERFSSGLKLLGKAELEDMISEGKPVPTYCHFCNSTYEFSVEEIRGLVGSVQ